MTTEADVLEIVGYLFGAYGIGWTAGYLFLSAQKVLELFR